MILCPPILPSFAGFSFFPEKLDDFTAIEQGRGQGFIQMAASDVLNFRSRQFYESTLVKMMLSIVFGAAACFFLGMASSSTCIDCDRAWAPQSDHYTPSTSVSVVTFQL